MSLVSRVCSTLRAIPRFRWMLVEAAQPEEHVADDQQRPALADDLESAPAMLHVWVL